MSPNQQRPFRSAFASFTDIPKNHVISSRPLCDAFAVFIILLGTPTFLRVLIFCIFITALSPAPPFRLKSLFSHFSFLWPFGSDVNPTSSSTLNYPPYASSSDHPLDSKSPNATFGLYSFFKTLLLNFIFACATIYLAPLLQNLVVVFATGIVSSLLGGGSYSFYNAILITLVVELFGFFTSLIPTRFFHVFCALRIFLPFKSCVDTSLPRTNSQSSTPVFYASSSSSSSTSLLSQLNPLKNDAFSELLKPATASATGVFKVASAVAASVNTAPTNKDAPIQGYNIDVNIGGGNGGAIGGSGINPGLYHPSAQSSSSTPPSISTITSILNFFPNSIRFLYGFDWYNELPTLLFQMMAVYVIWLGVQHFLRLNESGEISISSYLSYLLSYVPFFQSDTSIPSDSESKSESLEIVPFNYATNNDHNSSSNNNSNTHTNNNNNPGAPASSSSSFSSVYAMSVIEISVPYSASYRQPSRDGKSTNDGISSEPSLNNPTNMEQPPTAATTSSSTILDENNLDRPIGINNTNGTSTASSISSNMSFNNKVRGRKATTSAGTGNANPPDSSFTPAPSSANSITKRVNLALKRASAVKNNQPIWSTLASSVVMAARHEHMPNAIPYACDILPAETASLCFLTGGAQKFSSSNVVDIPEDTVVNIKEINESLKNARPLAQSYIADALAAAREHADVTTNALSPPTPISTDPSTSGTFVSYIFENVVGLAVTNVINPVAQLYSVKVNKVQWSQTIIKPMVVDENNMAISSETKEKPNSVFIAIHGLSSGTVYEIEIYYTPPNPEKEPAEVTLNHKNQILIGRNSVCTAFSFEDLRAHAKPSPGSSSHSSNQGVNDSTGSGPSSAGSTNSSSASSLAFVGTNYLYHYTSSFGSGSSGTGSNPSPAGNALGERSAPASLSTNPESLLNNLPFTFAPQPFPLNPITTLAKSLKKSHTTLVNYRNAQRQDQRQHQKRVEELNKDISTARNKTESQEKFSQKSQKRIKELEERIKTLDKSIDELNQQAVELEGKIPMVEKDYNDMKNQYNKKIQLAREVRKQELRIEKDLGLEEDQLKAEEEKIREKNEKQRARIEKLKSEKTKLNTEIEAAVKALLDFRKNARDLKLKRRKDISTEFSNAITKMETSVTETTSKTAELWKYIQSTTTQFQEYQQQQQQQQLPPTTLSPQHSQTQSSQQYQRHQPQNSISHMNSHSNLSLKASHSASSSFSHIAPFGNPTQNVSSDYEPLAPQGSTGSMGTNMMMVSGNSNISSIPISTTNSNRSASTSFSGQNNYLPGYIPGTISGPVIVPTLPNNNSTISGNQVLSSSAPTSSSGIFGPNASSGGNGSSSGFPMQFVPMTNSPALSQNSFPSPPQSTSSAMYPPTLNKTTPPSALVSVVPPSSTGVNGSNGNTFTASLTSPSPLISGPPSFSSTIPFPPVPTTGASLVSNPADLLAVPTQQQQQSLLYINRQIERQKSQEFAEKYSKNMRSQSFTAKPSDNPK